MNNGIKPELIVSCMQSKIGTPRGEAILKLIQSLIQPPKSPP